MSVGPLLSGGSPLAPAAAESNDGGAENAQGARRGYHRESGVDPLSQVVGVGVRLRASKPWSLPRGLSQPLPEEHRIEVELDDDGVVWNSKKDGAEAFIRRTNRFGIWRRDECIVHGIDR